jgi:hypothetical protein
VGTARPLYVPDHRLHLNVAAVISEAVVEIPDSNLLSPLTGEQSESYETALDRLQDYFFCKQLGAGDEVCYRVYCEVLCSGLRCP